MTREYAYAHKDARLTLTCIQISTNPCTHGCTCVYVCIEIDPVACTYAAMLVRVRVREPVLPKKRFDQHVSASVDGML